MPKQETVVETVKMDDERIVEFAGKKRLIKESFLKDGKVICRLDFRNGETRTMVLPESLLYKAAAHGLEQKLGDEISGVEDIEDAVQAIDELMARLEKGEWNSQRAGGTGMAGASILAKALVAVTGKTVEEVRAFLSNLTPAQKLALREDPTVKPTVQKLEAEKLAKAGEKAKKSVDTGALLGNLFGTAGSSSQPAQ